MERIDDGERLARPRLARGVPPVRREISTRGNCDTPAPPDGTVKARHNPFADVDECVSRFDLGNGHQTLARPGPCGWACSRCHMPTNYVDNVPLQNVTVDTRTGLEHGPLTSTSTRRRTMDRPPFATLAAQVRNTSSGKSGVVCMVCHSLAETRNTPYHNKGTTIASSGYIPALGMQSRAQLVSPADQDIVDVADPTTSNLGYGIGGGAFRLSPHAIAFPTSGPALVCSAAPGA